MTMSADEFAKFLGDDIVKWERIVKISGAKSNQWINDGHAAALAANQAAATNTSRCRPISIESPNSCVR